MRNVVPPGGRYSMSHDRGAGPSLHDAPRVACVIARAVPPGSAKVVPDLNSMALAKSNATLRRFQFPCSQAGFLFGLVAAAGLEWSRRPGGRT